MPVPAVFTRSSKDGNLYALRVSKGSTLPSDDVSMPFNEAVSSIPRNSTRGSIVVADWNSIPRREFTEDVVKRMRVRGMDIWFMTCISDADDLMDAFNTTADIVLGPVHLIRDRADLEDIASISDGFVPTVAIRSGAPIGMNMRVTDALVDLERIGFCRFCVMDSDGSVNGEVWDEIGESFPSTMPFVPDAEPLMNTGFREIISPLRL